jgi:hypothetical protein
MNIESRITKYNDLSTNDSLCEFDGLGCQQNYKVFKVFYDFLTKIKPKRILEIGTSMGGFTSFLNKVSKEENINFEILTYDINEYPWYPDLISDGIDVRIQDIFQFQDNKVNQEVIDFIQKDGLTIILCDGGFKILEFQVLSQYLKTGDFILIHDYCSTSEKFNEYINGKVWNWHEVADSDIDNICIKNGLENYDKETFESVVWGCKIKTENVVTTNEIKLVDLPKKSKITLVTGLWDLGRENLNEGWSRSYTHYLDKLLQLLQIEENLIIFGDSELEKFVFEKRRKENTQFIRRDLSWFKNSEFYDVIQKIRTDPSWYNQVGWLSESTQARLEMYNPLVMSKMFILHDAKIMDKFNSEYLFWIDAGLSNTVHPGYFTHDKVLSKIENKINKFTFICFPYETSSEIHGFKYPEINSYCSKEVKKVARGGFFGGKKEDISEINSIYYSLMRETLSDGFMGTEESIFSIMVYKYPDLIQYFEIDDNGLLSKFFEDCKNEKLDVKIEIDKTKKMQLDYNNVALYVITFNSPNQLQTLIDSIEIYDNDFLTNTKKYLLNNSTDRATDERYTQICEKYGFTNIGNGENMGITGGRQFIAEHFGTTTEDYMIFFEDDMFFYNGKDESCRNGFLRKTKNLYKKSLEICHNEDFDFLKLNFTEFYGDNSTQWSWYNVPQHFRESNWPLNKTLPKHGLDPNAPRTQFKEIKSHKGVPYASGEIYLCNWPVVFSKKGNYKCYLETKYASPFEQTIMSHNFQETIKGNLKPGILLMTPTEHNRFEHYDASLRKEC